MKRFLIVCVVLYGFAAIILMASAVFGQDCPGGVCLPRGAAVAVDAECPEFHWQQANEHQHWLVSGGQILGQWYVPENKFYPFDGHKDLPAFYPPIDPPKKGVQAQVSDQTKKWCQNGVHNQKRNHDYPVINFSGKNIHAHQLAQAFGGELSDDSQKGWFVVLAKDAKARAAVIDEWNRLPVDFRAKYLVWDLPPDHFSMQDRFSGKQRFTSEGDPAIILQDKDGGVLFRRPRAGLKYTPADFKDLLKSDPNYQPALDPGLPVAPAKPTVDLSKVPTWAWVGGGVLAVLLLRRKS